MMPDTGLPACFNDANPVAEQPLKRGPVAIPLLRLRVRIPPGLYGCLFLVIVVCCQVEVSASG